MYYHLSIYLLYVFINLNIKNKYILLNILYKYLIKYQIIYSNKIIKLFFI
jgi:hypothetical protein